MEKRYVLHCQQAILEEEHVEMLRMTAFRSATRGGT